MSWYPPTELEQYEVEYLQAIQEIWKIRTVKNEIEPYILEPHQIEWHKDDVALQQDEAPMLRIVIKSRNTSFTVSSSISNLMAVPYFPRQVVPIVRINITRAKDLIEEMKQLIKDMTPIKLPDKKDENGRIIEHGGYYPFDPSTVDMDAVGSIKFANGVEFRAFPATAAAAENIRGLRIIGSAGLLDETNFMRDFKSIYIATRDTFIGSDENGKSIFQVNVGTTIKGLQTPFKIWFDDIKKNIQNLPRTKIYEWPVFDPNKFDVEVAPSKQNLIPIVKWHSIENLNSKWLEDKKTFLQEYMAVAVESDSAFYSMADVMECVETGRKSVEHFHDDLLENEYYFGVDPAGEGGDFFSIVGINKNTLTEEYLFSKQHCDLTEMQEFCDTLFEKFNIVKMRIDGNGLGYQLSQYLKKQHGSRVEIIRGTNSVKIERKQTIPLKEYLHTNVKKLLTQKKLTLIDDELHIRQFTGWTYKYECERTLEEGHGDSVIALGLAVLPDRWRTGERTSTIETNKINRDTVLSNNTSHYSSEPDIFKRIDMYRNQRKRR